MADGSKFSVVTFSIFHLGCFLVFFLGGAAPTAYGSSQAKGWIRAVAAGLHHSHRNAGSKPHLQPIPWLWETLDP